MKAIGERASKALELVGGTLFLVSALLAASEVVLRYILHKSQDWTWDIAKDLCLLAVFLVAGVALAQGHHINIGVVFAYLKNRKALKVISLLNCLFAIGICAVFSLAGLAMTRGHFLTKMKTVTSIPVPFWVTDLMVPIGFLLIVVFAVGALVAIVRSPKGMAQLHGDGKDQVLGSDSK